MKTKLSFFLMLTAMLLSCTHNHRVRPTAPADYTSLNERGLRQTAMVTLNDEQKLTAEKLRFAPDSTSWVDPHTQNVITVPTAEVSNIQFVSRGKGALEGLGIGLLSGALFGAVVGFASGDDPPGDWSFTATEKAVILGIFGGGIGVLLGPPVGAGIGSRESYHIELDSLQSTSIVRE